MKDAAFYIIKNPTRARFVGDQIAALDPTKEWDVYVEPHSDKRSLQQNRLYSAWVRIIAKATGYSEKQMRAVLAARYIGVDNIRIGGAIVSVPKSTAGLKVKEMTAYMDEVYLLATGELGLTLPLPEQEGDWRA